MSPLRPTGDRDPLATLAGTEAHLRAEAGARMRAAENAPDHRCPSGALR